MRPRSLQRRHRHYCQKKTVHKHPKFYPVTLLSGISVSSCLPILQIGRIKLSHNTNTRDERTAEQMKREVTQCNLISSGLHGIESNVEGKSSLLANPPQHTLHALRNDKFSSTFDAFRWMSFHCVASCDDYLPHYGICTRLLSDWKSVDSDISSCTGTL